MSKVTVRPIKTKQDKKEYFNYPWKLYKGNKYWVPPLKSIRKHELDTEKGAAWEYMDGEFFIADCEGETVGIIAAFINHRHNETWNENIGWFGDIHFINNQDVATALLSAAEEWLKARGVDAIQGPATFTFHSLMGTRIDAFESQPVLLMPYNPEYFPKLIEAAGYEKEMDVYNWRLDYDVLNDTENPMRIRTSRVVEKNNKRRGIEVRRGNPKDKNKDFQIIQELYNTAWKDNWGFVPLTDRELEEMVNDLKDFYEPSMTFFAYVNGAPAGYLLGVPDLNQPIMKAYPRPGEPEIFTLLKVLWHWKIRPVIDGVRVPLLGVKEEYRKIGVDGALFLAAIDRALEVGLNHFDGGWVLETNDDMNKLCTAFNAYIESRYRIYKKNL